MATQSSAELSPQAQLFKERLGIKLMFLAKLHKKYKAGKTIAVDVFIVQRKTGRRAVLAPYVDEWTSVGYKIIAKILGSEIATGVPLP